MQNWGKKGCVFGHIDKFGKDMKTKLRKTHARTHIKGLFSYLKNMRVGCVLKAQSPFTGMISSGGTRIFVVGASRGQNAILRGQIFKNLPQMAYFGHFFFWWGEWGEAEPQTAGNVPMPPFMPPLMISSLKYKCPPESKLIYEYRENTWKIV